jgi:hypothetical protein
MEALKVGEREVEVSASVRIFENVVTDDRFGPTVSPIGHGPCPWRTN